MLFFKRKKIKEIEDKINILNENIERNRQSIDMLQKYMIDMNKNNQEIIIDIKNLIEKSEKQRNKDNELLIKKQEKICEVITNGMTEQIKDVLKNISSNYSDSKNNICSIKKELTEISNFNISNFNNVINEINNFSKINSNNFINVKKQVSDIEKKLKEEFEKNDTMHINVKSSIDRINYISQKSKNSINDIENEVRMLLLNSVMDKMPE